MKIRTFVACLTACAFPALSFSQTHEAMWAAHPFYFGVEGGWGTTDWSHLTVRATNPDDYITLSLSAPTSATDKGPVYGFMTGYEINPHFAMEMNYMRFPNTTVIFDPFSLYAFQDGIVEMNSSTYVYNIVGKFMVEMNNTGIRGFANAGASLIHRHDSLVDVGHIGATFGVGLGYVFPARVMLELAFQYYAGYGKVVLKPAINYIPFLYTVHLKLGYRF